MPLDLAPDDNTERIALENAGRVLIIRLREEFPRFAATCVEGESDGPYIEISSFAHFVDKEVQIDPLNIKRIDTGTNNAIQLRKNAPPSGKGTGPQR